MSGRFADNPSYVEYEKLLIQLHALIARGMGDTEEADNVRELMELPEKKLDRAEINRLNGLSRELYLIQGEEVLDPPVPPDLTMEGLREQLREAEAWNDWGAVLGLLRRRPLGVPSEAVAVTRSKVYSALAHPDPAIIFLDFAYRTNPSDPDYRALRMMLTRVAGRLSEAVDQAVRALGEVSPQVQLIVTSADVLLQAADECAGESRTDGFQRVLQTLQPLFGRRLEQSKVPPLFSVMAYVIQGAALSALGRDAEAFKAIDAAVAIDQGDSVLRNMRDQLKAQAADSNLPQTSISHALQHRRDLMRREFSPRQAA